MLDGFDPTTIADPALRAIVQFRMNQIEDVTTTVRDQRAEIQRLRDEINRLKGEQGQPTIAPNHPPSDGSSEGARTQSRPHRTCAKNPTLMIDRTVVLPCDPTTVPPDAVVKGYQCVIVQDIQLTTETIACDKAVWYSPSLRRRFRASNPTGYDGQFGPHTKAFIMTLAFETGISEPKMHALLRLAGLHSSRGQIAAILQRMTERLAPERHAILHAGLSSSPWQHLDATPSRVAGNNEQCHMLTNPFATVSTTTPRGDRRAVLDVLRGGTPRQFWLDQTSERLMRLMDVPTHAQKYVGRHMPHHQMLDEATVDALLTTIPQQQTKIANQWLKWIKDALASAAYHADRAPPVPKVIGLLGDDAPQWAMLTEELALCWVHDARHGYPLGDSLRTTA